MKKIILEIIASAVCLTWAGPIFAQNADVTFFVIGKHANFSQDASGQRQSIDYSFFSEVFLTNDLCHVRRHAGFISRQPRWHDDQATEKKVFQTG